MKLLLVGLMFSHCNRPANPNELSIPQLEVIKSDSEQAELDEQAASTEKNLVRDEPWVLSCDTIEYDPSRAYCISESYEIADSMLQELFKEQIYLLEHSNCNECREGLVDRQIELAKERQALFNKMRELTREYVGLEYEGGSIAPAMKCGQGREMVVNQINEMQSLLFPLRRAAGYEIERAMGYREVEE